MSTRNNNNSENKKNENGGGPSHRIFLTELEVSEISRLYDIALQSSGHTQLKDNPVVQNEDTTNERETSMLNRKKAWHNVQEYLEMLGKKYNYDPEKFVINKLTRELEPYKAKS